MLREDLRKCERMVNGRISMDPCASASAMRLTCGEERRALERKGKERKGTKGREGTEHWQIHWQLADTLGRGNRPELLRARYSTYSKVYQDVRVQTNTPTVRGLTGSCSTRIVLPLQQSVTQQCSFQCARSLTSLPHFPLPPPCCRPPSLPSFIRPCGLHFVVSYGAAQHEHGQ